LLFNLSTKRVTATVIMIATVAFVISARTIVNAYLSSVEVYITKKFIPPYFVLNGDNFDTYVSKEAVPETLANRLECLKANDINKNIIINSYSRVARLPGDFFTRSILWKKSYLPAKYLVASLQGMTDSDKLIPFDIDVDESDRALSKGIRKGDRIELWFYSDENIRLRYTNVPVIDFYYKDKQLSSLIVVMPIEVAKQYFMESKNSKKKIIFLPNAISYEKDNKNSDAFYDLLDIKIENLIGGL
tara:strand:+ start:15020 stop:15754 length:735 start_codon:yes stop_codon:yes gene_type:complete